MKLAKNLMFAALAVAGLTTSAIYAQATSGAVTKTDGTTFLKSSGNLELANLLDKLQQAQILEALSPQEKAELASFIGAIKAGQGQQILEKVRQKYFDGGNANALKFNKVTIFFEDECQGRQDCVAWRIVNVQVNGTGQSFSEAKQPANASTGK